MFEIQANALYSKSDLEAALDPLELTLEAFLDRVRPAKHFKSIWVGSDLLEAIRQAPVLKERSRPTPRVTQPRRKRTVPSTLPAAKVEAIREKFGLKSAA